MYIHVLISGVCYWWPWEYALALGVHVVLHLGYMQYKPLGHVWGLGHISC